jgi:hypothetical protein
MSSWSVKGLSASVSTLVDLARQVATMVANDVNVSARANHVLGVRAHVFSTDDQGMIKLKDVEGYELGFNGDDFKC